MASAIWRDGEPVEMTAILVGLVATAGGLVVLVASGLRVAGAHRQGLLATGVRLADSLHIRWLTGMGRPLSTWAQARRPVWLFGMTAALGVLLIAATAIGTDRLAEDITAGDGVAVLDYPVASFIAAHRSGALTTVMQAISSAGSPPILAAVMVVAGVLLGVLRRSLGPVLLAGATVAGTGVLTITLKEAVGRSRPPLDDALAAAEGHAFPSAHAATAAAVFGVLAYLFAARLRSWSVRVAVWAGAAMLTALVGISRIYLGVHWTTDIIGGWAFGVLWLAVVLTSWIITTRHRRDWSANPGPDRIGRPDPGPQNAGPDAAVRQSGGDPSNPPAQTGCDDRSAHPAGRGSCEHPGEDHARLRPGRAVTPSWPTALR